MTLAHAFRAIGVVMAIGATVFAAASAWYWLQFLAWGNDPWFASRALGYLVVMIVFFAFTYALGKAEERVA